MITETSNAQQQGQANPWQLAVDHELVTAHLGIAADGVTREEAAKRLGELIDWHVKVATDPAVNGGFRLMPVQQGGGETGAYTALRSILYNAENGSQDRPLHVRLQLIAEDARRAIAACEAAPPSAPVGVDFQGANR